MNEMNNIEWKKLGFKFFPTKHMFVATCSSEGWKVEGLRPFGNIEISPAAGVLNYGQGLFEGLKAYSGRDSNVYLFRPQKNAERIHNGCKRLCIPPLPLDIFVQAVNEVTKANREYVPPYQEDSIAQGALYLRPVVWGTGPVLGVSPAPSYTFVTYACPVGPYFRSGFECIKLKISDSHHRAAPGGTGGVKAIGNYCVGMMPAKAAKDEGFQEILYLDAKDNRYIEEVGAANFFCIKGNRLYTPNLDGCILPGVTRSSILHLAKHEFGMEVFEQKISVEDILDCDEAFASGTAAVITPIGSVQHQQKEIVINNSEPGTVSKKIYKMLLDIQHGITDDKYNWRSVVE
ncbi:branched-chain amino acid aminotransferase [Candidatus Uabimicrobium sp. HlEnr_7]|uniref:branched-chain amino acid aminotransferase n=1 Tax=Candidatus Uabimicrobium helgolandensis TaxID=3095367 RepID=UPI0035566C51